MIFEYKKDNYTISTNKSLLDRKIIHDTLNSTYWAKGITGEVIQKFIEHSLLMECMITRNK